MKQKNLLTKLLLLCLCVVGSVNASWADDPTYANPATTTHKVGEVEAQVFLNVAGTAANRTDTIGKYYLTYGVYYVAKTKGITTWFNSSDNSPGSNHESTGYSIENAANFGFYPTSSTSTDVNYGGTKCNSGRWRYFYVTGATSVAGIVRDGGTNNNKYAQLKIEEVNSDGSLGTPTLVGNFSSTSAYMVDGGALNPAKYYKISFGSPSSSNSYFYQVRFGKTPDQYTVSVAATPDGYGTVSAASITGIASGTTIGTDGTTLTVTGKTPITATATTQTDQYTYSFSKWQLSNGSDLPSTVTADLSVQAVFSRTARSYDVTLNTNGGTINSGDVTSYTYGTGATLPTDITKDGFDFAGWYPDEEFEGDRVYSIADDATGAKEYWAKWNTAAPTYAISFEKGVNTSATVPSGTTASNVTLEEIDSDNNYRFDGWKADQDVHEGAVDGTLISAGTLINAGINVYVGAATTFTAQWTQKFAVTFNSHGGTAVATQYVADGETAEEPTAPTRTNFTFDGWQLSGADYDFSTAVTAAIELDATWNRNEVSGVETDVTLVSTSASIGSTSPLTDVYYGNTAGFNYQGNAAISTGGSMFGTPSSKKWVGFTLPTGYTATVTANSTNTNERHCVLVTETDRAGQAASATLYLDITTNSQQTTKTSSTISAGSYALGSTSGGIDINSVVVHVTSIPLSVTLKVNDEQYQKITVTSGEKLGDIFASQTLPTIEMAGYTFNGWKNEANDEAVDNNTVITATMTIYADMTPETYDVTLLKGTNGTADGSAEVTMGATALSNVTDATAASGYVLGGYYAAIDGDVKVVNADGTLVASVEGYTDANSKWTKASDTELYAHWLATYTVTTSVNNGDYGSVTETQEGVAAGSNVVITATPKQAYKFSSWTIDGEENANTTNPYTFESIAADHSIQAVFVARKVVTYNVSTTINGTRTDNTTEYANDLDKWTAPANNKYLSSDNKTLTGWKDAGETSYTAGQEYTLTGNITLTPVFADNAEATFVETLDGSKTDFEVSWDFSDSYGNFNMQGTTGYLVKQATINTKSVDMPIAINTTTGKLNNVNRNDQWAQINTGTTLTIPVVDGSVVTVKSYGEFSTTTINGETAEDYKTSGTAGNYIAEYTYSGSTGTIDIVAGEGSGATSDIQYISYITVTYPTTFSPAPSISAGTFSFADKAYPVTITGETGTTKIETSVDDGANWTSQSLTDLACTVNVTAGQTLLARATVGEKEPSAEVSYTNNFDSGKSYIAWVSISKPANNDRLYNALKDVYNVVPVVYADTYSITADDDIKNSDLIFVDDKIAGGNNLAKGLYNFVNVKRMVNLKVWACTTATGRWGWGTAADLTTPTIEFDDNYKFLDGVSFSEGHKVEFFKSGTTGKQVLTLEFTAAPTNNKIFGSGTDDNTAMHAIVDAENLDKQYLGLGLSSNNVANYSDNAITVVKNAIAMMFANEALNTTMASVSGTINTTGWNTFSSSYPLDLSTISGGKAYYAESVDGTDVVLKPATGVVPAGEGLMIKGTTPGGTFTIDVADTDGTAIDGNLLVGLPSGGTVAVSTDGSYNYVYAWQTANPSTTYGFYNVNSKAATLGAGKAYLHLTSAIPTSGRVSIIFDDEETTGIKAIDSSKMTVDSYYDLSGRKVAQPQKGLYIVNGKKVIVK